MGQKEVPDSSNIENMGTSSFNSMPPISSCSAFTAWLSAGNAKEYTTSVLVFRFSQISDYALKTNLISVDLWLIWQPSFFATIYNKLRRELLWIMEIEKDARKVFTVAGQLYLKFLQEQPFNKKNGVEATVITEPTNRQEYLQNMTALHETNLGNMNASLCNSLAPTSLRSEFTAWLSTGNAKEYTPSELAFSFDKIADRAFKIKLISVDLWLIRQPSVFAPICDKLMEERLLWVIEREARKVFTIAGQLYLKFLNGLLFNKKSFEVVTIVSEPTNIPDYLGKMETSFKINPEDVISWLLTQPNAPGTLYLKNVVQQYIKALLSAPAKLKLSKTVNRNVFDCHTVAEVHALWYTFMTASNYKQVDASTSRAFSVGMRCLSRYLGQLSNENRNEQLLNQEFSRDNKNRILLFDSHQNKFDPLVIDKLTKVLTVRFPNGFRISSPIELARFRNFALDDLGENILLSDENLRQYICICGTVFDSKIYAVSAQTKLRIKTFADAHFEGGAKAIFYAEFYAKNEDWLLSASIVSEDMLIHILRELFPNLSFTRTYFGYTNVAIVTILESEILRVWGDDILLTYKQLAERLQYIPLDRIKNALSQNGDFIWNSSETFSHVSRIDITMSEREAIREAAMGECNARSYASIANLPFGEIEERNNELSITAIQNAVYHTCLSDKFDKKGKIVTRNGDVFDAMIIMKEYCRAIDKCSLDDLLKFEKELTGEEHRWIAMGAGNTTMVRIDRNTYVADKYVLFEVTAVDEAIELFVERDYLPLKSFTTFGAFPDCGQEWNLFLLESYCLRFSRKFRLDTPSVNSRNAGAVIRKSCEMDYTEIMTDAVAKANIHLKDAVVGKFLYENGYTSRSTIAKAGEIIDKAKTIRERID